MFDDGRNRVGKRKRISHDVNYGWCGLWSDRKKKAGFKKIPGYFLGKGCSPSLSLFSVNPTGESPPWSRILSLSH
jgi:hypothetical protein